jgi:hypothetical protein
MLYNVSNIWDDGYVEDFIAHSKKGYSVDFKSIKSSVVQPFKYKINSILPPGLINVNNRKYITPNWIPCHPQTELSDIDWVKITPTKNEIKEVNIWRFKSSSGDGEYVTKKVGVKFSCNCPGFWRAKDRDKGCKHIQEIKTYNT